MSSVPGIAEVTQIFKRLRSNPSNKLCFDCNSKNPTWSSVTYGIFICIDCSGVHRNMGVHLTFVRSTQLDSNWTWQQLRQMQLGGNENAMSFFRQHNVNSNDILQKYKSRAAQLYRDKLHHTATQAMRLHGTKLFIDKIERRTSQNSSEGGDNDADFFDHDIHKSTLSDTPIQISLVDNGTLNKAEPEDGAEPNVEAALSMSPTQAQEKLGTRKPTIGQRKPAKKGGQLGAKKSGGLGAQKVKKDFSEIEKEAEMADQVKYKLEEDRKIDETKRIEDQSKAAANMRLAYQDLALQQNKKEEKLRNVDAKKAAQVERLGMGAGSSKGGIGHSVLNQMNTIVQEEPLANKGYDGRSSNRGIEDDFEVIGSDWRTTSSFGTKSRTDNAFSDTNKNGDDEFFGGFGGNDSKSSNTWEKEFEVMKLGSERSSNKTSITTTATSNWSNSFEDSKSSDSRPTKGSYAAFNTKSSSSIPPIQEDAVKKFGSAKAISSDMYFGNQDNGNEDNNSASRFQGQSSISSAEYFNRPEELTYAQKYGQYGPGMAAPDMSEVKESVKEGVSKVAGRLSGMASGVMTQLRDKYGY